jgi:hypothetical protein
MCIVSQKCYYNHVVVVVAQNRSVNMLFRGSQKLEPAEYFQIFSDDHNFIEMSARQARIEVAVAKLRGNERQV